MVLKYEWITLLLQKPVRANSTFVQKKIADDQAADRHPKLQSHNEIKRGEKKARFWQPQQRIKYQRNI